MRQSLWQLSYRAHQLLLLLVSLIGGWIAYLSGGRTAPLVLAVLAITTGLLSIKSP